jgi:hypothetical protein
MLLYASQEQRDAMTRIAESDDGRHLMAFLAQRITDLDRLSRPLTDPNRAVHVNGQRAALADFGQAFHTLLEERAKR